VFDPTLVPDPVAWLMDNVATPRGKALIGCNVEQPPAPSANDQPDGADAVPDAAAARIATPQTSTPPGHPRQRPRRCSRASDDSFGPLRGFGMFIVLPQARITPITHPLQIESRS
jgi:hypothetical protein